MALPFPVSYSSVPSLFYSFSFPFLHLSVFRLRFSPINARLARTAFAFSTPSCSATLLFLGLFISLPYCPFIHLFLRLSIPCLSHRVCPEWLVPFPRLAVLPTFYSLVSLSLCLSNSVWPERLLPFPVSPSV